MQVLRFITRNPHKIAEVTAILRADGIKVIPYEKTIEELQTTDVVKLVRDKALRAYERVGRPLFVEHTSLHLEHLNGLPGGLTQIFWDSLEADRFAELFGRLAPNRRVTARTVIGYCDGKRIRVFNGDVKGAVVDTPRGSRAFQWDCVFQPAGYTKTFAEMGAQQKNKISMRRIALKKLAKHIAKLKP